MPCGWGEGFIPSATTARQRTAVTTVGQRSGLARQGRRRGGGATHDALVQAGELKTRTGRVSNLVVREATEEATSPVETRAATHPFLADDPDKGMRGALVVQLAGRHLARRLDAAAASPRRDALLCLEADLDCGAEREEGPHPHPPGERASRGGGRAARERGRTSVKGVTGQERCHACAWGARGGQRGVRPWSRLRTR
mgnify:CR=1 FL=1